MQSEAWNIEFANFKFFPRFWVKIPGFTPFWTNSRHFPSLEEKMTKFQVFKVFHVEWEPWTSITQCSHTLPRIIFLPFPYFFLTWWPIFPTNFAWNCVKSRGYGFLTIWFCLRSNMKYPTFCFNELRYVFFTPLKTWNCLHLLTFWPISQPFLPLSANSLPFQGLKILKTDSSLFQDFPYLWEPW